MRPNLLVLIPYAVLLTKDRRRDPITSTRIVYLSFVLGLVLYGVVLLFLAPFRSSHNGVVWAIAIGASAPVNLIVIQRVERPLSCDSDSALAGSYRTRLFLRIAFAESTALLGFVAAFLIAGNWIYFFGVIFSRPALLRASPSPAALVRDQDELAGRGCARSLIEALRTTPPKPR